MNNHQNLFFIDFAKIMILPLLLLNLNAYGLQLLHSKDGFDKIGQSLSKTNIEQPLSTKKILTQLQKEAKSGDSRSQFSLANMYQKGINVKKDTSLAFYWYSQVAESGYHSAQFIVAEAYYNGIGVDKDFQKALTWYELSARQDSTEAQYKLAQIYHFGKGAPLDYSKAYYWYKKAAELGSAPAQLQLAEFYEQGLGVGKDLAAAQYWYEKLAMQSDAKAQQRLASLFTKPVATYDADEISRSLNDNTKILKKQIKSTALDAENGNSVAQHNLSLLLSSGNLLPKDDIKAFKLMQKSARQGLAKSQNALAIMYIKGLGVEVNYQTAYYWASLSAKQNNNSGKQIVLYLRLLGQYDGQETK